MRRLYLLLIAVGILAFLGVSALLARAWSADGAESSAITGLVKSEARGDETGALEQIQGCRFSGPCRARVAKDVAALAHPGSVTVIQMTPSTGFSLTGTLGTARVAWEVGSSLPIVQCVRVRRAGNVFEGLRVELLQISLRIHSNADCPSRF